MDDKMIIHDVGFNSQRDNFSYNGKFMGWNQCFTTCSWMFMSFYSKKIVAEDDSGLSIYFDDVEDSVGNPGIGEIIKRKYNWITGSTSYWWLVQREGIEKWLWREGIEGNAYFKEQIDFNNLFDLVDKGPVILGTNKLGGLHNGHIILVVGRNGSEFVINDPFGDATTNYKNQSGENVIYSEEVLLKHAGSKINCMYWRGVS